MLDRPELITWAVILGTCLFAVLYATWLAWRTEGRLTLSGLLDEWSQTNPGIPLWVGILLGHLFAQMGGPH